MESEFLPGGSGGVWRRRGDDGVVRVHRPTGPWTPAVHELLAHLAAQGLDGIPAVHGIDDDGLEVLEFLPGETLDPEATVAPERALAGAAAWLRRFHDAVRDFRPGQREWRQGMQDLGPDELICHNDPGLYNWVIAGDRFAGMIDWDRAGPGRPLDDLAFLCWTGVPLMRETPIENAAARLALAAGEYGGVTAEELLGAVDRRMRLISERWAAGIERGDPGTLALRDAGIMDRHHARVRAYADRRGALLEALATL